MQARFVSVVMSRRACAFGVFLHALLIDMVDNSWRFDQQRLRAYDRAVSRETSSLGRFIQDR